MAIGPGRDEGKHELAEQQRQLDHLIHRLQFNDFSSGRLHEAAQLAIFSYQGAGQWLLGQESYRQWCEADSGGGVAGLLWVYGQPGSGKTVLASIVIEDMKRRQKPNSAVIYLYCDYKDKTNADPFNILCSLLDQLLGGLKPPFSPSILKVLNDHSSESQTALSADVVLDVIGTVAKEYRDVTFIVDALDECRKREETRIFSWLLQLSKSVRLFVTSRDEPDIMASLASYAKHVIPLTRDNCLEDIRRYVLAAVESYSDQAAFFRQDSLRDEIVKTLVTNAHGMFLWVDFQLADIRLCGSLSEARETLQNLPKDLTATFVRSLHTINDLPGLQRDCVRRILRWVVCTGGILLTDLLTILSVEAMTDSWDEDSILTDGYSVIDLCAHLVSLTRGEHPRVVPTHHSVYTFLTSDPGLSSPPSGYHVFPLSTGYKTCGHSLNKYLRLCPFPRQAVRFACKVMGGWLFQKAFDANIPQFCSLSFAAPEIKHPPLNFPTYPDVTHVKAVDCSFLWAENVFSVFPTGDYHQRRVSYGAFGFTSIFPNVKTLALERASCISTGTVLSICETPGNQSITLGPPQPHDGSNDGTCATVIGMRFVQGYKTCWEIYPLSGMFRNEFAESNIKIAEMTVCNSTLYQHEGQGLARATVGEDLGLFGSPVAHIEGTTSSLVDDIRYAVDIIEALKPGGVFTNFCRIGHLPRVAAPVASDD